MDLFVSWDGDGIGRVVGKARLSNDVELVRRTSASIDRGNEVFRSWALEAAGSVVEIGGDEGAVQVPAERVGELPSIKERYEDAVGATVTIGVGVTLADASKALMAAKLSGKNQIRFHTDEDDDVIKRAQEAAPDEAQKIQEEYLDKAQPAMNTGEHAGFAGAKQPEQPSRAQPVPSQGDHEEGQAILDLLDRDPVESPEQTHAARDYERELHDEAWKGEEEDMKGQVDQSGRLDQVREQVLQALQVLKVKAPVLEQVRQVDPDAYAATMGLVQSVIAMARELKPAQGQPLGKSEALAKADGVRDRVRRLTRQVQSVLTPDLLKPEYQGAKHCLAGHCYVASEAMYHLLGGKEGGWTPMRVQHEGGPHWFLRHASGRIVDPTAAQFKTPPPYDRARGGGFLTYPVPSERARDVMERMLSERTLAPADVAGVTGPQPDSLSGEEMAKAAKALPKEALKRPTQAQREELVHYSVKPGLKRVDVKHMGTGAPAAEYRQGLPEVPRAYYYRAGSKPEPIVTQGARAVYRAYLDPAKHRLYDIGADPEGLRGPTRERFLAGEGLGSPEDTLLDEVKRRGYYGYHNSASQLPHVVALFHAHPVEKAELEKVEVEHPGQPSDDEPLVTHPDPRGHVVYRVQNAAGEGPYNVGSMSEHPEAGTVRSHAVKHFYMAPQELPTKGGSQHGLVQPVSRRNPTSAQPQPFDDFDDDEWSGLSDDVRHQLYYGFESPEHARTWFGNDALAAMKEHGYELQPIRAQQVWRSKSGRQVLFLPHEEAGLNKTGDAWDADKRTLRDLHAKAEVRLPSQPVGASIAEAPSGAAGSALSVNKIKVQHNDGTTSTKQVQAGQIRSMDPAGHPTSSRSPNSK